MMLQGPQSAGWTPAEEERIKAVVGKSVTNGVKSLSNMLGVAVLPATWGMLKASIKEPPLGLFSPSQGTYSVFMPVQGDLIGTCLLCFSVPSAESMLDHMLKQLGPSARVSLEGMVQSALEEAGNIFLNECIKTLGQEMKIEIYPATPKLEHGPWDKMWSKLALSQLTVGDGLNALYADFTWTYAQRLGQFFLCLSPDSWDRLKHWALRGKSLVTSVGLGNMEVSNSPTVLKASDLGSCVALIIYDHSKKTGAMAHVMLPRAPSPEAAASRPGKYADHAVASMLKRLKPTRGKLTAWLVGGADMLMPFISSLGSIGSQNAEVLRQEIKRAGLKLMGEDVGGTQARTVELLTETGELWIKWGQRQRREHMGMP